VRWGEVTALFGGTFDPPHLGHRLAVAGLFEQPGVKNVRILPTPSPAYKPTVAPTEARLEMARLCFALLAPGAPAFPGPVELDLREIERSKNGQPTYTFDTLRELGRELPELAFVLGTDQVEKFPTWHRFDELLSLSHWIVLERQGQGDAHRWRQVLEGSGLVEPASGGWRVRSSGTRIVVVPTRAPALSSTEIRESLARSGNPPEGSILPEVHAYLMKHRLYGSNPDYDSRKK
jgi:nicotinate-nucleotide adenylyltransferase